MEKNKENGIAIIHPCAEDSSKVTCESYLTGKPLTEKEFDLCKACRIIHDDATPGKDDYSCSLKLGFVKFKVAEKTVLLFKNGKIIVKRAENERDALETVDRVKEMVSGAFVLA